MDVVIVEAVRTPLAQRGGGLRGWHAVDLLAATLQASLERSGLNARDIGHVTAGCASPIGEQAINVARNAVLSAGWPERISATSLDAQSISSLLALQNAAGLVAIGESGAVIASGVESISRVPPGATSGAAVGKPFGPAVHERYAPVDGLVAPGIVAERMASRYGFGRSELDIYAELSRSRFTSAAESAGFKVEIAPLALRNDKGLETASSVDRDDVAAYDIATLKPLFEPDGVITAANFAAPADGAAAVMIASNETAQRLELQPLARVAGIASVGTDPINGDSGAEVARVLLERAALSFADLQRIELHEDSAATALAFIHDTKVNAGVVNPDGGALAFGDAFGATGARLIATLVHGMHRTGDRNGMAVVAGAGGMAAAVLLERL